MKSLQLERENFDVSPKFFTQLVILMTFQKKLSQRCFDQKKVYDASQVFVFNVPSWGCSR